MAYKRVLLKLSGEQLAGDSDGGFEPERAAWLAVEIKKALASGVEIVIVVGGGNFVRGGGGSGGQGYALVEWV
jgi:uridylate kinase